MTDEQDREAEEMRALARKLGRRGGLKGGKARAEKLTSEEVGVNPQSGWGAVG